jgi:hypothetical protein
MNKTLKPLQRKEKDLENIIDYSTLSIYIKK